MMSITYAQINISALERVDAFAAQDTPDRIDAGTKVRFKNYAECVLGGEVEGRRDSLGAPRPALSLAGASIASPCHVSTPPLIELDGGARQIWGRSHAATWV